MATESHSIFHSGIAPKSAKISFTTPTATPGISDRIFAVVQNMRRASEMRRTTVIRAR